MDCSIIRYTEHVLFRIAEKAIALADVEATLRDGEVIMEYPSDKPYPSRLLFFLTLRGPLHVVVGHDEVTGLCIVITAYWPDKALWSADYKRKLKKP